MDRRILRRKIDRLRNGESPQVLDLFAGCGGLSLGFQSAGFNIAGAIELDDLAARSHATNFYGNGQEGDFERHAASRDIVEIEPQELISELKIGKPKSAIDVIVGGPPCQAYARVGRAKLREVFNHPKAFLNDPRRNLYLRFIAFIQELQPIAILMENVPDVMNIGGHNVSEETCDVLNELGYACAYTLLNSAFYGVPQMRERMFLIAYAKELDVAIKFPRPTHWAELPVGYEGSRSVALRNLGINGNGLRNGQRSLFQEKHSFKMPPVASPSQTPAVTAKEAIGDLPPITLHLEGKLPRGARRFDTLLPYDPTRTISSYANLMRSWRGFESDVGIKDHVIRSLPRDYPIFRRMEPGNQYPEAHVHAMQLLDERVAQLRSKGETVSNSDYEELKRQIVPPYDIGKFPNKWRKMEADRPARTLMAHIGKDSYSHIHYDSRQARTISVREAARLQSFPDGFVFCGTMNPAFRQIGNAVPPLLAQAIAKRMLRAIRTGK